MLQYHPLDRDKALEICQYIDPTPKFTMLEFGVAIGNTMSAMLDAMLHVGLKPGQVIGFDSFDGLPIEDSTATPNPDWFPSAFNLVSELQNKGLNVTKEHGIEIVKHRLAAYQTHGINVQLIIGWYNALTAETVQQYQIKPASYIHMDCDAYVSAIEALTWLAKNDLIANGCIIRYDDWQENYNMGENKAHFEIISRFKYRADVIPSAIPGNIFFRFTK